MRTSSLRSSWMALVHSQDVDCVHRHAQPVHVLPDQELLFAAFERVNCTRAHTCGQLESCGIREASRVTRSQTARGFCLCHSTYWSESDGGTEQFHRNVENRIYDNNRRKKADAIMNVTFRFIFDLTGDSNRESPYFGSNRSVGTTSRTSVAGRSALS